MTAKKKKMRRPFQWRPAERRTLSAFVSALVGDGLPPVSPRMHDAILAECAKTINVLPRFVRDGFHVFLSIIEFIPLCFGYFRTFSRLPQAERIGFLKAWSESKITRVRMGFLGLKTLLTMAIASTPEIESAAQYAPECLSESSAR